LQHLFYFIADVRTA